MGTASKEGEDRARSAGDEVAIISQTPDIRWDILGRVRGKREWVIFFSDFGGYLFFLRIFTLQTDGQSESSCRRGSVCDWEAGTSIG